MADTLHTPTEDLHQTLLDMGTRARAASAALAKAGPDARTKAIGAMADALVAAERSILAANVRDLAGGKDKGLSAAMMDRLALDPDRVGQRVDGKAQPVAFHAHRADHFLVGK